MAPSPGKIHQLPGNIDTSPHSYVTVLSGLQDVYVHYSAPSYSSGQTHTGPLQGSCVLKGVARAVCYASPECIPDNQCLDFSLYNLDPTERTPFPHAFNPAPDVTPSSWTGKGFMSWVLSESSPGTTLVRGKLVREYEFSSHHFHDMEGGLEALVAAANSTARKQDEADGKGWGLEVNVSLRQVNPEGKAEFKGRRAFEASLTKGGSDGQAPNSTNGMLSSPVAQRFPSQLQSGQNFAARPAGVGLGMEKTESKSPGSHKKPTNQASNGQAAGNAQSNRPSSAMGRPASSTGLPPSSFPRSSSSNLGQSRPSSSLSQNPPSRTAQSNFQPPRPPQPAASDAVFQPPAPPKPAQPRPVTPPPAPRSKSPPPSTPSRRHLQALLKADGNMSPDLARHLAANPMLRQILKAVPPGASLLSQLRSVKVDDLAGGQVQDLKREGDEKDRGSPAEPTTPTPSGPKTPLTQKPQSKQQPQNSQAAQQAKALQAAQGCCNCGTMVSSCWRVRKMKEGPPRKVCDDCGVYFNEHKQMRPQELWDPKPAPGGNATAGPGPSTSANASQSAEQKRRSQSHHPSSDLFSDGPAVRSSPRLRRRESQDHPTPTANNHYNTRSHPSEQALPPPTPRTAALMGSVAESPRKRYKSKAGQVADSPRMATRASARAGPSEFSSEVFGFALGDDGSAHSHSGHTPAAHHHTGQANPAALTPMLSNVSTTPIRLNHASSHTNPTDNTLPSVDESGNNLDPDFDINAFLSSMDNQTLGADDFDLNSLFTGQDGGEVNGELNLEIMELLANWDEDASGDGGDKGLPQSEGMDVDGSGL
ncbi:hypothetical protein L198_06412 [Cryptococcus wingfieldii CBS 7118]|uniref:GATA-type domain-containing protein n=1 Tax=Cryptococcus wingfieldii CBS 7118 TaxID=1295528 RepID=A0A1E3IMH3_9TREE|nr:hypothetical protein L198_06412 [Cryptococcus wingfieldii CBS 7118]ODN89718.1 hypothetical protein L198_06412 [Cryptococcus wingfieldii CBS 7118]